MKIGKDSSPATKRCFFTCLLSLYLLFGSLTSGFAASEANMQKAILSGNAAKVQDYLKEGFYVESILPNKSTPLITATAEGKKEIVQILLAAGANPNLKIGGGRFALISAAQYGYTDIADMLIKAGANVNLGRDDDVTPLMVAAGNGKVSVTDLLLKSGANVNAGDDVRKTALIFAAFMGYPEVVELLVNSGADVNATDKSGWTALMFAIGSTNRNSNATPSNTVRSATILLDRGTDISTSVVGFTSNKTQIQTHVKPVFYASGDPVSANVDVLRLLLDRGATVMDAYNDPETHETLLQYIIKIRNQYKDVNQYNKIVELIKQAEAREKATASPKPNSPNGSNEASKLLGRSVMQGDMNGFNRALEMGADINYVDKGSSPCLNIAIMLDRKEMADILISRGVNVNLVDQQNGATALLFATMKGDASMVQRLIGLGANVNVATNKGVTPLSVAQKNNRQDIVIMLQTAGATK